MPRSITVTNALVSQWRTTPEIKSCHSEKSGGPVFPLGAGGAGDFGCAGGFGSVFLLVDPGGRPGPLLGVSLPVECSPSGF